MGHYQAWRRALQSSVLEQGNNATCTFRIYSPPQKKMSYWAVLSIALHFWMLSFLQIIITKSYHKVAGFYSCFSAIGELAQEWNAHPVFHIFILSLYFSSHNPLNFATKWCESRISDAAGLWTCQKVSQINSECLNTFTPIEGMWVSSPSLTSLGKKKEKRILPLPKKRKNQ